ncbi:MAG: carbohydrate ABC transporter substrate-binding protein [Longibaculum sp.]
MNTKKVLSLGLSVLMCGTLLAGCGGNKDKAETGDTESKTLTIAGLDGGYGTDGWKKVIAKFEKDNGVKITSTFDKKISDVVRPKITAGKDVPDIIYLSVGGVGGLTDTMIKEKQIADISGLLDLEVPGEKVKVSEKILDGFVDTPVTKPYGDGKLYLAPLNYGPCGLYYNAGLFKEKGWTVPKTWDEMWALGDKAKAEGISLFTYPTTGYFDAFFSSLLNATAGPEVYTKLMNYDVDAWKLPEVKEAFEIVGKLAKYTAPTTVANANGDNYLKNQQLIIDGKALFCPNGNWLPGEMAATTPKGFQWGVAGIPAAKAGGSSYSTNFVEQMYVPAKAANKDLAMKFMAYCYSDEAAKLFYENGPTNDKGEKQAGGLMPIVGSEKLIAESDQFMYSMLQNGVKANTVGFMAANPVEGVKLDGETGILYGTVNSVVSGDKTVDQWYKASVDAVQKIADANK